METEKWKTARWKNSPGVMQLWLIARSFRSKSNTVKRVAIESQFSCKLPFNEFNDASGNAFADCRTCNNICTEVFNQSHSLIKQFIFLSQQLSSHFVFTWFQPFHSSKEVLGQFYFWIKMHFCDIVHFEIVSSSTWRNIRIWSLFWYLMTIIKTNNGNIHLHL